MWSYLFHKSMSFMKIPLREKTANWHQDESHGVIEARIWFKFGWILGKVMKVIRCCATLTCVQHFTRWNSGTCPILLMILLGKEWVCYNILQIDTDWNHELTENNKPGFAFATCWCQVRLFVLQCFGNISGGSQLVLEALHQRNHFCPLFPMKVSFCKRSQTLDVADSYKITKDEHYLFSTRVLWQKLGTLHEQ